MRSLAMAVDAAGGGVATGELQEHGVASRPVTRQPPGGQSVGAAAMAAGLVQSLRAELRLQQPGTAARLG
jgi:hypothetical protein